MKLLFTVAAIAIALGAASAKMEPVNCAGHFTECSALCTKTFVVDTEAQNGGMPCEHEEDDMRLCDHGEGDCALALRTRRNLNTTNSTGQTTGQTSSGSTTSGSTTSGSTSSATTAPNTGSNGTNSATTGGTGGTATGCFPADATVRVEGGTTKKMEDLEVGDRVMVDADGTFEDVYLFTHRLGADDAKAKFVVLTTENGANLSLTANHYLYVNGELVAAREARVGQIVGTTSGDSKIVKVEHQWNGGLYAPKTLSGGIMVNDVLVSSYTDFLPAALTHSILLPVRMLYKVSPKLVEGVNGPPAWLEKAMVETRGMLPF